MHLLKSWFRAYLMSTSDFIIMGVFPSKSDESPLNTGTPPVSKQGFVNPGSTLCWKRKGPWPSPHECDVGQEGPVSLHITICGVKLGMLGFLTRRTSSMG